jgi:hypothetical protein
MTWAVEDSVKDLVSFLSAQSQCSKINLILQYKRKLFIGKMQKKHSFYYYHQF